MNAEIPENADSRSASFRQITDAFLSQDGLPFSEENFGAIQSEVTFRLVLWMAPFRPRAAQIRRCRSSFAIADILDGPDAGMTLLIWACTVRSIGR